MNGTALLGRIHLQGGWGGGGVGGDGHVLCNRSKTSASFSSGVPNTEKRMKARRRRRSAFIVSRCLEPLMKNEARVFELASQTSVKI